LTQAFPKLILASRSPRRQEILRAAGYEFEVKLPTAAAEQGLCGCEPPADHVARLAYQKAADVARRISSGLILACDTVAYCNGQILGKPKDAEDAGRMLQVLCGREHQVFSGLCLWSVPEGRVMLRTAVSTLRMDELSPQQIAGYIAEGGWREKAGAFGYQDGLDWVHLIEGSSSNVVGLPLELLAEMLADWSSQAEKNIAPTKNSSS